MIDLKEIIKGIEDLTPVPHAVNQVLAKAQNPKTAMRDVADVIVYDSVMTANMMKSSVYLTLKSRMFILSYRYLMKRKAKSKLLFRWNNRGKASLG